MKQQVLGDPFELLGVTEAATHEEIRLAHRKRIRESHPDVGGSTVESALLNWARDELMDDAKRCEYIIRRKASSRYASHESRSTGPDPQPQPNQNPNPRPEHGPRASSRQQGDEWANRARQAPQTDYFGAWQAARAAQKRSSAWSWVAWAPTALVLVGLSYIPLTTMVAVLTSGVMHSHEQGAFVLTGIAWALAFGAWWRRDKASAPVGGLTQGSRAVAWAIALLCLASAGIFLANQSIGPRTAAGPQASSAYGQDAFEQVPGTAWAPGACRSGKVGDRPVPDPDCSPGVLVDDASRSAVCKSTLSTQRPKDRSRWEAKDDVLTSYARTAKSAEASNGPLAFVVPLKLGGAWHLQNLWMGETSATSEVVQGVIELLCRGSSPVTYDQVIKAAQANRLDLLLRRYA